MQLTLIQQSGAGTGRRELLSPGQSLRVGRTEWADFSVPDDPRISSVHFELRWDGRAANLRDLNSSNGTRVNGRTVTECALGSGDSIQAGQTQFRVEFAASPQDTVIPTDSAVTETLTTQPRLHETLRETPPPARVMGIDDAVRPFSRGLSDPDPRVRRAALLAAAWSGQPWLLDHCRRVAEQPSCEREAELWLYCVLAPPTDLPRIVSWGRQSQLGAWRFRLLGTFGHPGVVPELLRALHSPDPRTAVGAGRAFRWMTGVDIDAETRVELPGEREADAAGGESGDETVAEVSESVSLPDPQRAVAYWEQAHQRFEQGTRWRLGWDVSRFPAPDVLAELDLPSREEVFLRAAYAGSSTPGQRHDSHYSTSGG